MSYRARDGNTYNHRETPSEYRRRRSGGSDGDNGCCGCLILIALFVFFFC